MPCHLLSACCNSSFAHYLLTIIASYSPVAKRQMQIGERDEKGDAWTKPDTEAGWTDNGSASWNGSDASAASGGVDALRRPPAERSCLIIGCSDRGMMQRRPVDVVRSLGLQRVPILNGTGG